MTEKTNIDELESRKSTEPSYDSDENRPTSPTEGANQNNYESDASKTAYKSTISLQRGGTSTNAQSNSPYQASSGFYDAEKCRAHIANRTKVSRIDRFAVQVGNAIEIEADIQIRLGKLMNLFRKHTARVAHDFTFRCKLGLSRHRQDRILNQKREVSVHSASSKHIRGKKAIRHTTAAASTRQTARLGAIGKSLPPISNDLLYGSGAQLVRSLLLQSGSFSVNNKRSGKRANGEELLARLISASNGEASSAASLTDDDCQLSELFEPHLFVCHLEERLISLMDRSKLIGSQLNNVRQLFERLAMDHRDQVDAVYAAEEERQTAAGVVRRSTYNLSMAAFKATSTPVHVNNS